MSPWTDILAASLPLVVVLTVAVLSLLAARRRSGALALVAAGWMVFGLVAIVGPWRPRPSTSPDSPVVVASVNAAVPQNSQASNEVANAVLAQDADVLVISELPPSLHALLADKYPHNRRNNPLFTQDLQTSVGVYSRHALIDMEPVDRPESGWGLRVKVDSPHPFVLYAAHLPALRFRDDVLTNRATPSRQRSVVDALIDAIGDETEPAVLAGDLNVSDRSRSFRSLDASLHDAMRSRWATPTSRRPSVAWPLLALRIDHVFVTQGWCAAEPTRFAVPTSDHVGVRTNIGPCPS